MKEMSALKLSWLFIVLVLCIIFQCTEQNGRHNVNNDGTNNKNVSTEGKGYFYHISDWHIDPFYSPLFNSSTHCRNRTAFIEDIIDDAFWNTNKSEDGSYRPKNKEWWRSQLKSTPNFQFGQYGCDSPLPLAEAATGDMSAHHLPTWNTRSESINVTSQLLRTSFPNTFIFPSLGNNDCFPDDDLRLKPEFEPKKWLENLWSIWNSYLDIPNEEYDHFVKGGFYSAKINENLLVISMNTIYLYSSHNPPINSTEDPDPAGQFSWMKSLLDDALANSYSVFIIGHVPPGAYWQSDYSSSYQSLISQYYEVIAGQFFGHTHNDQFTVLFDDPDDHSKVISSYFISPSLTPRSENNPTFRLVSYNRTDISLQNYHQYYTDLVGATRNGVVDFRLEYQFTELYAQVSAGSEAVYNAVQLIYSNPIYYNVWLMNYNAQFSNPDQKENFICGMYNIAHKNLENCETSNPYTAYYPFDLI